MRATVALDDELVGKAQELTGVTERTALLRAALKALIHLEASRRLAAVGGTEPDLKEIKRVRADSLVSRRKRGRRTSRSHERGYACRAHGVDMAA